MDPYPVVATKRGVRGRWNSPVDAFIPLASRRNRRVNRVSHFESRFRLPSYSRFARSDLANVFVGQKVLWPPLAEEFRRVG